MSNNTKEAIPDNDTKVSFQQQGNITRTAKNNTPYNHDEPKPPSTQRNHHHQQLLHYEQENEKKIHMIQDRLSFVPSWLLKHLIKVHEKRKELIVNHIEPIALQLFSPPSTVITPLIVNHHQKYRQEIYHDLSSLGKSSIPSSSSFATSPSLLNSSISSISSSNNNNTRIFQLEKEDKILPFQTHANNHSSSSSIATAPLEDTINHKRTTTASIDGIDVDELFNFDNNSISAKSIRRFHQSGLNSNNSNSNNNINLDNNINNNIIGMHRKLNFLPNYIEDVSAYHESSMSFASLVMLFISMICIGLVFISCFYHNQKTSPLFISPRRHRLPKLVPPPLPVNSFFSWITIIFFLNDEEIISRIGYDALIFLRFHRLALRCIVKMFVFSFIVILPLNFTGGGHANASDLKGYVGSLLFTDFLRFTMANVSGGSPRLWVHCFGIYLLTGIVVRELLVEYEVFNSIRHRYLLSREPHLRTVLVTNIPRHLRAQSKISKYFQSLYPNNVIQNVVLCQNLIKLETLINQRTKILSTIESELLILCRTEKRKLFISKRKLKLSTIISSWWSWGSSSVTRCSGSDGGGIFTSTSDRLTALYSQLSAMNSQIEHEQRRRKRVMKKINKMDAYDGSTEDIDYLLASPFVGDNMANNKKIGLQGGQITKSKNKKRQQQQQQQQQKRTEKGGTSDESFYRPPQPIGAPRNADGTLRDHFHDADDTVLINTNDNTSSAQQPQQQVTFATIHNDQSLSGLGTTTAVSTGPVLRSSSPTTICGTDEQNRREADSNQLAYDEDDEKEKQKRSKQNNNGNNVRPFKSAKRALRRYSSLSRDVTFLGRPKPGSKNLDNVVTKTTTTTTTTTTSDGSHSNSSNSNMPPEQETTSQQQQQQQQQQFVYGNNFDGSNYHSTDHIEDHINEVTDKAFVTMTTYTASTVAIQSMHSSKPGSMQVTTAPEPRDILWENIYVSKGAVRTRSYIGEGLVMLLIGFYVVPIALVSLLVSESALVSSSPKLAQLAEASAFFSSAIAMVQPLCVVGLQQLVPPLFIGIGRAEGLIAFSEVQMKAFSRYFLFQVVNVFLVTTIAGSIFDTIAIIIENPEAAFQMLGNSLPRMSSFFVTFATIKTFFGLGIELVRTMALVQASLRYILFPNATLRDQRSIRLGMRAIDDPGWFPFHKILAQDMLVVVISVVFAVVAPIVLLPCALFCTFSRIMWTHHHLYVYESCFETGGQFWPKIFRRFVFGLIIAQMTITGQFILKEARHEAYATIALMFMTYFFLRSTRARYDRASSTLPLEVATVMDINLAQEEEALKRLQHLQEQKQKKGEGDSPRGEGSSSNIHDDTVIDQDFDYDEFYDERFLGTRIGRHDPFRRAYLQPALRANPRAKPEQPFPPAQLGREHVLLGLHQDHHPMVNVGGTPGSGGGNVYSSGATVRLKSLNQQERRLIDRWWKDQIQRCGKQNIVAVIAGEECGTLTIGKRANLVETSPNRQHEIV